MSTPVEHRENDTGVASITAIGGFIAVMDEIIALGGVNWTKAFSGTNVAAYKQPTAAGDFYIRVDDTNAAYTELVGYKNMTDIDTGTDPFPDAGSGYFRKYDSAAGDQSGWGCMITDRFFHLFNRFGTTDSDLSSVSFGKPNGIDDSDAYGALLMCAEGNSGTSSTASVLTRNNSNLGSWWCRNNAGDAGAADLYRGFGPNTSYAWEASGVTHPLAGRSGSYIAPMALCDDSARAIVRGYMPGFLCSSARQPWGNEESVTLAGNYAGSARFYRGYVNGGMLVSLHDDMWD